LNRASLALHESCSGPKADPFAPDGKGSRKNPAKILKKVVENSGEWRLCEVPKRHFAVPSRVGTRLEAAGL
jgi:hypothetical protein